MCVRRVHKGLSVLPVCASLWLVIPTSWRNIAGMELDAWQHMDSHCCSKRCRRHRGRSSPGSQWRLQHNQAPSSGGWSSPSDGSRTCGTPQSTACTPEKTSSTRKLRCDCKRHRLWSHLITAGPDFTMDTVNHCSHSAADVMTGSSQAL